MLTCHSCGETGIPDGTATCPICGQPLGLTVQQQLPAAPIAAIASGSTGQNPVPAGPAAISGSTAGSIAALIPRDAAGNEDISRAYALPNGAFRLLLGRTDMSAVPPIVAQIDVAKLWPDLNTRPAGNLFSRATAVIRRDASGTEFLMHHPDSSMKLVFKRAGELEYQTLLPGDEISLAPDTELVFGKSSEAQVFTVR